MRSLPGEAAAPATSSSNEVVSLDEEFLRRVDRLMLRRKQTDPFQREAVRRATEEQARLRQFQVPEEVPLRSSPW
ncbi:hypothetical protein [Variovorax sp. CF313]|uniref:hypothetical protein n=1 Tax=Variovorax sp. CF313 TaxID=1144315 RepID=UPI0012F7574D|nr:hypothetical protein [Variovorax sp. CF313]